MKPSFLLVLTFFVSTPLLQADNWDLFPFNQKTYYYFRTSQGETISTYFMDYEEETEEGVLQFPLRAYIESLLPICYPPPLGDFVEGH